MIDDFCAGDLNVKGADYFSDTINQIDDSTGKWTSTYMCTSDYCNCAQSVDFSKWNETELNSFNRTNSLVLATANPKYKILSKNATGYTTFYDCYKWLLVQQNNLNTGSSTG
jgi:hypothetical protein